MLTALVDLDDQMQQRGDHDGMHKGAPAATDVELQRMLRNERIHGPSDRDPDAMSKDMVYFSGPFVMVRDLKGTHRPIMVREYEKVQKREDGVWPQFRSTPTGKCPFVDEQAALKGKEKEKELRDKEREREKEREAERVRLKEQKKAQEDEEVARKRAAARMQPPAPPQSTRSRATKTLEDLNPQDNRPNYGRSAAPAASGLSRTQPGGTTRLFNVPSVVPAKRISNEMAFTSNTKSAVGQPSQNPRYAYEPAASGVQPSNITSAIRSQVVSSFVDIPGAKTAMSKDMLELKRKAAVGPHILDPVASRKASTVSRAAGIVNYSVPAATTKPEQRTALGKGEIRRLGKPVPIFEDGGAGQVGRRPVGASGAVLKPERKKELKPGYCENCREKFDDFDDVRVVSSLFSFILLT